MGPPSFVEPVWLVGFLELSRSKMEGCPKPSIANPTFSAHAAQNAGGSRGLGRPLLAKSKGAEDCRAVGQHPRQVSGAGGSGVPERDLGGGPQALPTRSRGSQDGSQIGSSRAREFQEESQEQPEGPRARRGVLGRSQDSAVGTLRPPKKTKMTSTVRARPGTSVEASSAHVNGQRRSRQFRV